MEHRAETPLDRLLHGHADGMAVALRACPEEMYQALIGRCNGQAPGRLMIYEPCRAEHPHSAFLRKPMEATGRPGTQTTLYAPAGRLTEERTGDGEVLGRFVRKPADFETLRGHLRDVELHPAKAHPQGVSALADLGLTPVRAMEARWAGPELAAWALTTQDESAASCLRKLERQLHRRCEEALRAGCRAGLLRDMAAEPLPETYMLHAGRHIEWMRHAGMAPWVEVLNPAPPLLAALAAARAGARISLANPALYEDSFAPPDGMRFLFDVPAGPDVGGLWTGLVRDMAKKCACAIFLVDCFEHVEEDIVNRMDMIQDIVR